MSLYNMMFGVNHMAPILLKTIGLDANDVPRFRDAFLQNDHIVIHTRTGGGNRDFYESLETCQENYPEDFTGEDYPDGPWNSDLTCNQYYSHDEDDDFDSTYANFYFNFPPEYESDLKALSESNSTYTPSEKWQMLFETFDKS